MGNCLVVEEKVVRVMETDGKILEYKHPIKAHQILSEFSHHAISDKYPVVKYMQPNAEMVGGHLYYLLPLPPPIKKTKTKTKKKVRFSDEVLEEGGPAAVRIKVVMSKKELVRMLSEGEVTIDDIISKCKTTNKDAFMISKGWSPALDCIPELC